jgi:hypothetical protein
MPRFFFNVRNDMHADDEEGCVLPDLAAAREHALEGARDLVCTDIKRGWLNLDHYVEVLDDRRQTVLTLTFRDAFEIRSD